MENLWEEAAESAASLETWQWKKSPCLESDVVVLMRQRYESAKDTKEQRNTFVIACRADGMSREDFVQHIKSRFPGNRMANRRARLLLAWWKKTGEGKRPKKRRGRLPAKLSWSSTPDDQNQKCSNALPEPGLCTAANCSQSIASTYPLCRGSFCGTHCLDKECRRHYSKNGTRVKKLPLACLV